MNNSGFINGSSMTCAKRTEAVSPSVLLLARLETPNLAHLAQLANLVAQATDTRKARS